MNALKTIPLARPRRECKPSNARYSVSDGRDLAGIVEQVAGGFAAITTGGTVIGTFASLRARALPDGGAP